MNINNVTLENLKWVRDVAIPASHLRINDDNLAKVMRGRALILGYPFTPVGCFSCSARSEFKVSQSVLEQHESAILAKIAELEAGEITASKDEVTWVGEESFTSTSMPQESPENGEVLAKPAIKKTKKQTTVKESWEEKNEE
jgi:hypothetical protein